ncbi:MAG: hypothetical protein PVJ47_02450 [Thiohalocapsa sp.]|jgi:hypothetical protein
MHKETLIGWWSDLALLCAVAGGGAAGDSVGPAELIKVFKPDGWSCRTWTAQRRTGSRQASTACAIASGP